jgi:hypothetical protein
VVKFNQLIFFALTRADQNSLTKGVCIMSENENKNDSAKNPFGVGEEFFDNIIRTKSIYVDKTKLIYNLVSDPFSHVPRFLSRPRRFGKTLLLDTMQNVFEGNRELFSGLAIESLMGDRWDAFPVIRISFNTIIQIPRLSLSQAC